MTSYEQTLTRYFSAYANTYAAAFCRYHGSTIQFRDPAFGLLIGNDACQIWKMLIEKRKGKLKLNIPI